MGAHTYKGDGDKNCLKTKSRVVAKGSTQVQDVDYRETTSPTPASAPVKMIAIVNEKGLPVFHLDVSRAFVQAPLEEEMYMRLPPGCDELSSKVVKLLKYQYGLKQAGREWHFLLVPWLVEKSEWSNAKPTRVFFLRSSKTRCHWWSPLLRAVPVHSPTSSYSPAPFLLVCDKAMSRVEQRSRVEAAAAALVSEGLTANDRTVPGANPANAAVPVNVQRNRGIAIEFVAAPTSDQTSGSGE